MLMWLGSGSLIEVVSAVCHSDAALSSVMYCCFCSDLEAEVHSAALIQPA